MGQTVEFERIVQVFDRHTTDGVDEISHPGEVDQSVMVDFDAEVLPDDQLLIRHAADRERMVYFRVAIARQHDARVPRNREHPANPVLGVDMDDRERIRPHLDVDRLARTGVDPHHQHRQRPCGHRRGVGRRHEQALLLDMVLRGSSVDHGVGVALKYFATDLRRRRAEIIKRGQLRRCVPCAGGQNREQQRQQ